MIGQQADQANDLFDFGSSTARNDTPLVLDDMTREVLPTSGAHPRGYGGGAEGLAR